MSTTHANIKTASLGFSRIGQNRELKFALEKFWAGKISFSELESVAKEIRQHNWKLQENLDYIPSGDFSFYDHVLDISFEFSNIPSKFSAISDETDRYFAVARGFQSSFQENGLNLHACDMSKWFNTNYHYIIPEFHADVQPKYSPRKFVKQFLEAKALGIVTRPVIIGPVSYLLLGKEKSATRNEVFSAILECYKNLLSDLKANGCNDVQIDEPFLATEIDASTKELYTKAFGELSTIGLNLHLVTYFDSTQENTEFAFSLPVKSVHLDVTEYSLPKIPKTDKVISIGIVSGRNIWKNNLGKSVKFVREIVAQFPKNEIIVASSCSFLHVPYSIEAETNLDAKIKNRLAFAKEKIAEIDLIKNAAIAGKILESEDFSIPKNAKVWEEIAKLNGDYSRQSPFAVRKEVQKSLGIPLFPTTTIGSFPQNDAIRKNRSDFKKSVKTLEQYNDFCKETIRDCIKRQEEIGLDVLVHGECERNDMVEYFGENFDGFCFTQNGWVQSYGSRCVKPPVIYGDVSRTQAITVEWAKFAQSCSKKHVKGMLTGPVTILKWSFVRDDIAQEIVCKQIALALQEEVLDLEKAGIKIIQIDEPAIREILPVRKSKWNEVLSWAVDSFKISCQKVNNETQIHTHVCYSEFNDIISHIVALDADVLSIESSRSDLEVLSVLTDGGYKNDIGPGVWDIHSPRIPSKEEIRNIILKALEVLSPEQIWVNPDCGLKTRKWEETVESLKNLVAVAKEFRG